MNDQLVFISHATVDNDFVRELLEVLNAPAS